jgi:uncharacterized membrane-anchored protein YitT (DUF2179 family)
MSRRISALLLVLVVPALAATRAAAHDVPGEMRLHAFLKPEGKRLHVLVRVPLALLLNLDLPKRGPGYIDLARIDEALPRAVAATDKDLEFFEDGRRLVLATWSARISTPSDRAFDSYEKARALLAGPPPPVATDVFWNQGWFDASLEYEIRSPGSTFALDFHVSPGLGDRLKLDLRHVALDGVVRAYELPTGSGQIVLDPRWYQAAWSFVRSGFAHILDGLDHLLFLLCLVLPFRRIDWRLAGMVTSFTVAHSVTLISAAYGLVPSDPWFPALVETLIAVSILYTAIENVVRPRMERRWLVAGIFGLVHGFGFSFVLGSQLQFAGSHLLVSLVAFNVGIELGQLLALSFAVPVLVFLARTVRVNDRLLTAIPSVLVAHTAWHWSAERFATLRKEAWPLSGATASSAPALAALLAAAAGGAAWLAVRHLRRRAEHSTGREGDTRPAVD